MNLTDDDKIAFGKYRGTRLGDVPADYLLWLWDNGTHAQKNTPMHNYIKDAFDALESEAEDYIVKYPPWNGDGGV